MIDFGCPAAKISLDSQLQHGGEFDKSRTRPRAGKSPTVKGSSPIVCSFLNNSKMFHGKSF